jgi:hypothetical protein
LPKGEVQSQQRREHSVNQSVAKGRQQNDEREFDARVKGLQGTAPAADGGAKETGSNEDRDKTQLQAVHPLLFKPMAEQGWVCAQQLAQQMRVERAKESGLRRAHAQAVQRC